MAMFRAASNAILPMAWAAAMIARCVRLFAAIYGITTGMAPRIAWIQAIAKRRVCAFLAMVL